jgi:hypothetical protein
VLQAVSRRGYAVCLERVILGYRGGAMQDLGYELPRIPILGNSVNKACLRLGTKAEKKTHQREESAIAEGFLVPTSWVRLVRNW